VLFRSKESTRKRQIKHKIEDVFKIRPKKEKELDKKRGIGIPSLKGAVCYTSKDKKYLYDIAKAIGINNVQKITRFNICEVIRQRLLFLEKYSLSKEKNKYTFMIIPHNHSIYEFPYNLEDRIEYIKNNIFNILFKKVNIDVQKLDNGIFENVREKKLVRYELLIKKEQINEKHYEQLENIGFKIDNNYLKKIIE
jgi:hypothetical protein